MSEPIWRKGPPPSIGWWPASVNRDVEDLRWWNGKWWGFYCDKTYTLQKVAICANSRAPRQDDIEWTDRPDDWPERSKT